MSLSINEYFKEVRSVLPSALNRGSTEKLSEFPSDLKNLLQLSNGQKARKASLLPSPDCNPPHLQLLSAEDILNHRYNNLGFNQLLRMGVKPKLKGAELGFTFWRKSWWPMAASECMTRVLFIDADNGAVYFQISQVYEIERRFVASSIEELFAKYNADLKFGVFSIEKSIGVRFAINESVIDESSYDSVAWEKSRKDYFLIGNEATLLGLLSEVVKKYETFLGATFGVGYKKNVRSLIPKLLRESYEYVTGWCWPLSGYDQITLLPPEELDEDNHQFALEEVVAKSKKVKPFYMSKNRIRFAFSDYHEFQIDFDPTPDGASGQVVVVDMEEETVDFFCESIDAFFMRAIVAMNARMQSPL
jgi:cell wall assembly regulator SMI1